MKKERDPTPAEFEKLLAWLASAGRDYEAMHHRLIRIFVSRGCIDAESLADEVMNRVAARIDEIVKIYEGDPAKCFHGFAKRVYLECLRDRRESFVESAPPAIILDEEREQESEQKDICLTQCMADLDTSDRDLFQRYFQEEKRAKINARKDLASDLRVTANALRIKAHRIRRRLRKCMEGCLEQIRGPETIPA